jgi:hypothetical protein
MKWILCFFCLFIFFEEAKAQGRICFPTFMKFDDLKIIGAGVDCASCIKEQKTVTTEVTNSVEPILKTFSKDEDVESKLARLQGLNSYLLQKDAKKDCSNFPNLAYLLITESLEELKICEQGLDFMGKRKALCTWVLESYNNAISTALINYKYRRFQTADKNLTEDQIEAEHDKQVDKIFRSHYSWCQQVEKAYRNKNNFNCNSLEKHIVELNEYSGLSESTKKKIDKDLASIPMPDRRSSSLEHICQSFEKIKKTESLFGFAYFHCLTRQYK